MSSYAPYRDSLSGSWSPEKRDRRQYAAKRDKEIADYMGAYSGKDPYQGLAELGITNEKEHGMARFNQFKQAQEFGLGNTPNNIWDFAGGKKFDPLYTQGYAPGTRLQNNPFDDSIHGNSGGWLNITPQERAAYDEAQGRIGKYGSNYNPYRINTLEGDIAHNNVQLDPLTGHYMDYDPSRGTSYFDDQYRLLSKTPGAPNTGPSGIRNPPTPVNPRPLPTGPTGPYNPYTPPTTSPYNTGGNPGKVDTGLPQTPQQLNESPMTPDVTGGWGLGGNFGRRGRRKNPSLGSVRYNG